MGWFWKRPSKQVVPLVQFLGEQDGPPERELKKGMAEILSTDPRVARAYLARVGYGQSGDEVALCISGPDDPRLVNQIGRYVHGVLPKGVHMDVLFLSGSQESELARCCRPFYVAGPAAC
jgi:hypothetical protein